MFKITLLFFVTALAEIIGCFLPYLWLRKGGSSWLLLPAALSLSLFVWLLTLHPAASGRVYAAYGGVYVVTALVWLRVVDGVKLSTTDWLGAVVADYCFRLAHGGLRTRVQNTPSVKRLRFAVHIQTGERLADRHHFKTIDIDAGRQRRDPKHGFRNIFCRQRIGIVVNFAYAVVITFEAYI